MKKIFKMHFLLFKWLIWIWKQNWEIFEKYRNKIHEQQFFCFDQIYDKLESLKLPPKCQEDPLYFPVSAASTCFPILLTLTVLADSLVTGAGELSLHTHRIGGIHTLR